MINQLKSSKELKDLKGLLKHVCSLCGEEIPSNLHQCTACAELRSKVLREIADNWYMDAASENEKYFHNTNESQQLMNGKKCFVIGRKGIGKTAIARYIHKHNGLDWQTFSKLPIYSELPLAFLHEKTRAEFNIFNQDIIIWKYLIYYNICIMMSNNNNLAPAVTEKLKRVFGINPKDPLSRLTEKLTIKSFNLNLLKDIISISVDGDYSKDELSLVEVTKILEIFIMDCQDTAKYFIIFDDLDDNYIYVDSDEERQRYNQLLTSLFRATLEIRSKAVERNISIYPIVFLRTDIFENLRDSNKNKWSDFLINLDTSVTKNIKNMLSHRIFKTAETVNYEGHQFSFEQAWRLIFNDELVPGGKKKHENFKYITRRTQSRPRDYIKFIKECAALAITRNNLITSKIIKEAEYLYSKHLRDEIVDEIHVVMPDIESIFKIFQKIGAKRLETNEFIEKHNVCVEKGEIGDNGAEKTLSCLFDFSVIGNILNIQNRVAYKYQNVDSQFNEDAKIEIHPGLHYTLQLF